MIVSLTNLRYWLITNSVITWMMDLTITGLILPEERENKWWWCTRLSEISLFVRPVIRLLDDWSARLWQITLFCENGVQNLFYHSITKFVFIFKSLSSIYEKRNAILYTRTWLQLRMSRIFAGNNLQVTWWALGQRKGRGKRQLLDGVENGRVCVILPGLRLHWQITQTSGLLIIEAINAKNRIQYLFYYAYT